MKKKKKKIQVQIHFGFLCDIFVAFLSRYTFIFHTKNQIVYKITIKITKLDEFDYTKIQLVY
jgi:hypothetical protein